MIYSKLYMNGHWMVPLKADVLLHGSEIEHDRHSRILYFTIDTMKKWIKAFLRNHKHDWTQTLHEWSLDGAFRADICNVDQKSNMATAEGLSFFSMDTASTDVIISNHDSV